ncbi:MULTISPECIES: class I SAM-dependent methyltransferase [Archaeoglobus]|jgi:2-polyprenyl-3-methyl-5-hydroxy-6-metoxy-1,4-benzoquinol methylase|uniref:rRNA (Adenine-N6)-methyltransferase, putative n=3 Tax=Archaeoglobus fulgidus TaxID=2234 RepID=O28089_ARCFU|nr:MULTISPECIES: class I SAM-dependent methyltransferase [Archaeoglobus]AAB89062.1 rRNA (adenine-N6)-methyltransferase, putative [Archaeoglobus fulgidus DSM 4304]AIG99182.1 Methyltransferase domain protein [Archaeoglobus fulgidus DSM 8774]KUJ93328.1 MAG: rRNA (Adenine-N6)-methyltransferase, putative [Archaeoglobus fulgidus]KUK07343.1 MAG: rRNA (Adenine-N6)-methyltransferase, putative [Archaeoglobus fulgidus]MDI3498579.1 hypothetical protein [Archaeoglobus sp.]
MKHKFDPKKAHILDSEWRRKIFPPEKVVEFIESLRPKKNVLFDVGAGTGYLTIPLARVFKKVYAVEISEEMAEVLRRRVEEEGLLNIGIIVSEKPPEVDFRVDVVLFSNVLHEMDNPEEYLEWASRADYVVVAEWKKEKTEFGPPVEERLSLEELENLSKMKLVKSENLSYHYLAAFKKV